MSFVWANERVTVDDVRVHFSSTHPMKDSTVRTVLRRLESKGYLRHAVDGRRYRYSPVSSGPDVAAEAVQKMVDGFCGGSIECLLRAMVENAIVDCEELERLAAQVATSRKRSTVTMVG